jgi:hypothetical protein
MREVSIVTRLSRWTSVRMTAMAVILAGTGLVLSGAAPAAGQQVVQATVEYTCSPPSGWHSIAAQVTVSIPQAATAGQPIRPTAAAVTVTLPRADRARLANLHAKTVSVTPQLRSQVMESRTSVADHWAVKAVSAAMPSQGGLVLHAPATVQPVIEVKAGNAIFTSAGLSLLLAPQAAQGTTAASAPMRLACTLNPGQAATLATVPVMAVTGHPTAAPATAAGHFLTGLWQSAPGGNVKGKSKKVALKDVATGAVISCTSSSITGAFKFGQQLAKAGIASFSSVTILTCTGSGGKAFTITTSASAGHPWLVNAKSFNDTSEVTAVTISGIEASISGAGCHATIAGPSPTTPGTAGATLSVTTVVANLVNTLSFSPSGTLHAWNVSGCSGLFNTGDALTFTATYTTPDTTPAQYLQPADCPPFPVKNGIPFNRHFKFPSPPPGSTTEPPQPPVQACAFIKGFSDVQKLSEAALVGPGFGNVDDGKLIILNEKKNYEQIDSSGKLYYKPCPGKSPECRAISGLPPARATFLSFGFMPTTATLQVTQVGTLNIVEVGNLVPGVLKYTKVQSLASIRIKNVSVNGTPLDVGSDCHTVTPFPLVLTGRPPYSLNNGGVLSGKITVPQFTGCGVGENIDPIFDASVSGSGNYAQLTQGRLCFGWNQTGSFTSGCPANMPKPVH